MSLALGTYPVTGLKDARKVERRGRLETAHRLRSFAGRVFGYAIWTSRAKTDPTAMISALRTPKVTNNAAIVEAKPLGSFMREIDAFEGGAPIAFRYESSRCHFDRHWSPWNEGLGCQENSLSIKIV